MIRSEIIEEWLRLAALAQARRELDSATVAYYQDRTAEQQAEDEGLAAFSTRSSREIGLDRKDRTRRRRARWFSVGGSTGPGWKSPGRS